MTTKEIHEITGLVFCDEDCPCGDNSQLWFTTSETPAEWKIANGWPTDDVVSTIEERTLKGANDGKI